MSVVVLVYIKLVTFPVCIILTRKKELVALSYCLMEVLLL